VHYGYPDQGAYSNDDNVYAASIYDVYEVVGHHRILRGTVSCGIAWYFGQLPTINCGAEYPDGQPIPPTDLSVISSLRVDSIDPNLTLAYITVGGNR
jgi:hypothetical protein